MVGRALHVGFSSQGIDATAGYTYVCQQKLQDGIGANHLGAISMLGRAHGVHNGACLTCLAGGGVSSADLKEGFLGSARDTTHLFRGIAGKLLLQQLKDTIGVFQGFVCLGDTLVSQLIRPGRLIVLPLAVVRA